MSRGEGILVRPAEVQDCNVLLDMMRKLAVFEGYERDFRVTGNTLLERLFDKEEFQVLVAVAGNQPIGMLVYYLLPFTYDLCPWLYMKELYVEEGYRRKGVGSRLLQALGRVCQARGVARVRFDVLASNHVARDFYRRLGAAEQTNWDLFSLHAQALLNLAVRGTA